MSLSLVSASHELELELERLELADDRGQGQAHEQLLVGTQPHRPPTSLTRCLTRFISYLVRGCGAGSGGSTRKSQLLGNNNHLSLPFSPHRYGLTSYTAHAYMGTTGYHSVEQHPGLTAISCRSSLHSICGAFTRFASGKRAQACRALWPPLMLSAEESCLPRNNMQGTRAPCLLNDQPAFNSHRSSPRTPCSLPDLLYNVTQSRIPPFPALCAAASQHGGSGYLPRTSPGSWRSGQPSGHGKRRHS